MSEINTHNKTEDIHHLDKDINRLKDEGTLTITQWWQLMYAYHKSINDFKRPKTEEEEKQNPSITKKDNEVTLRQVIETLNITIWKNDHILTREAGINYHPTELMRTLRKIWNSDTNNNTPIELFETLHSMSINEFFSEKNDQTALRNTLLCWFNQYYPHNESNQKRTVGDDFSVPELVKLLWNKTTATGIKRMWPKTYCRLENIFGEHKLELNEYLKWSEGKKKKGEKKQVDTSGTNEVTILKILSSDNSVY